MKSSDPPRRASQETRHTFPKAKRVRKQHEFERVYATKNYLADDMLVVNFAKNDNSNTENPLHVTRLGLSISRRVGNAVIRNRWKRRIREAFRLVYGEFPAGVDIVVRPRQGAVCNFHRIQTSMRGIAKRMKARLAR